MRRFRLVMQMISLISILSSSAIADASQQTVPDQAPAYDASVLEPYAHPGRAQIVGRAVVDTKTFGPVIFANAKIRLIPFTDYNFWWIHRLGDDLANAGKGFGYPSDLTRFNRETLSDAQGYFSFNDIPAGNYLLDMLTDYEQDSNRIETNTIYTSTDDGYPTTFTSQRLKTKLRRELDFVAAQAHFKRADERLQVDGFTILGAWTCCRGEI